MLFSDWFFFYTFFILDQEGSLDQLLLQNLIFIAIYTYRVVTNHKVSIGRRKNYFIKISPY